MKMKPDWNKPWGGAGGEIDRLVKPFKKLIPKKKRKAKKK